MEKINNYVLLLLLIYGSSLQAMDVDSNFQKELEVILKGAGTILLSYFGKQLVRKEKCDGFVTEADFASERYLIEKLTNLFRADIWAEESGQTNSYNNGYCWVIDPLDGTTDFAHGIPYFCISVALTYHDQPKCAAIYNPLLDDFFYAQKGIGAWCNGQKISISLPTDISKAVIAFNLPYAFDERISLMLLVQKLAMSVGALRSIGSTALDLAHIAAGRLDGVLFTHHKWWDVAAGMLLVQEAGGKIADFQGEMLAPSYQSCIAGGGLIFDNLFKLVSVVK